MIASLLELVTFWTRTAPWLVAFWLAAVGGCVGSFLNVVVYRLPAGISLVHPGSRCPRCGHAIRARDNIPVVGWLILRGRCRDCGAPIAPRYPLVEAFVAVYFVVQWWVDMGRMAATTSSDAEWWLMCLVYLLHLLLVCSLLAAALIDRDGHAVPWSLGWPLATLVAACCLGYPDALRAAWALPGAKWIVWVVLATGLLGAVMATYCTRFWRARGTPSGPVILGGGIGLVLGPAAGLLITATALVERLPWCRQDGWRWPGWITAAVALYQSADGATWLGRLPAWADWVCWPLLVLVAVSLAATARGEPHSAT